MDLAGTGYSPIFVDGQWDLESELHGIESLIARQVDALVLIGGTIPDASLKETSQRCPLLVIGHDTSEVGVPSLNIDNFQAGYLATKHLIDFGHAKIAMVCGVAEQRDAKDRYKGYLQAHRDANLPVDLDLVCEGDFSAQSGMLAVNSLVAQGKLFSAVFAANDLSAMGARLALHRYGLRVPEDISLVGIDDQIESSFMTPPLTTVRQPAIEIGTRAAQGIVQILNQRTCESAILPAELQVRESTAGDDSAV